MIKTEKNEKCVKVTTPSFYGSHLSMVVPSEDFEVNLLENQVICQDDTHCYITTKDRLDTGLADPNRYGSKTKLKKIQKEE